MRYLILDQSPITSYFETHMEWDELKPLLIEIMDNHPEEEWGYQLDLILDYIGSINMDGEREDDIPEHLTFLDNDLLDQDTTPGTEIIKRETGWEFLHFRHL